MANDVSALWAMRNSGIEEISGAAEKAIDLHNKLSNNLISLSEYEELISDIVKLDNIDKEMFEADVYSAIKKAFVVIKTLNTVASIL